MEQYLGLIDKNKFLYIGPCSNAGITFSQTDKLSIKEVYFASEFWCKIKGQHLVKALFQTELRANAEHPMRKDKVLCVSYPAPSSSSHESTTSTHGGLVFI